jgi:hypothetical protein
MLIKRRGAAVYSMPISVLFMGSGDWAFLLSLGWGRHEK